MTTPPKKANQPEALVPVQASSHKDHLSIGMGAIYDFAGFLTTREKRITASLTDEAGPMGDALKEFFAKRGIDDNQTPAIHSWHVEPPAAPQAAVDAGPRKRWPFVETPGEFTERLREAIRTFGDLLPAVRNVLIENPAQIKQGADGPLSELTPKRSPDVEEAILTHQWRDSPAYGGEICASCGAVKGSAKSWRKCGFTGEGAQS